MYLLSADLGDVWLAHNSEWKYGSVGLYERGEKGAGDGLFLYNLPYKDSEQTCCNFHDSIF